MTKNLVLLSFACLAVLGTQAQASGSLGLSIGPCFPVGDFASKSGQNANAGLANTGEVAALGYWHAFRRSPLGVVGSARLTVNPVDAASTIMPFEQSEPGYEWSMGKSRWGSGALLVGLYYQPALSRRVDLRIKGEAGAALCYFPSLLVMGVQYSTGDSTANVVEASLKGTHAVSFSAVAGVGLSYHCSRHTMLLLEADGAYAHPTFRHVQGTMLYAADLVVPGVISLSNARGAVIASTYTRRVTQPMNSLAVTAGFAYSW